MIKGNRGTTLIELIIALAVIGILCSSFLGIQLNFAKINRISRQHLTAGSIAGNLYEIAKGMKISDFIDWSSTGSTLLDGFLFSIEAERYWPETSTNNVNYIDLIVSQSSDDNFLCHSMGDSIKDTYSFTGEGQLQIQLIADNSSIRLVLIDGFNNSTNLSFHTVKANRVVNIYAHGMPEDQEVLMLVEESPTTNLEIRIHEPSFHKGCIKVQTEDQEINTKELWQAYQHDNLLVTSRKSERSKGIPVYLQIEAYEIDEAGQQTGKPISRRQGVIPLITD